MHKEERLMATGITKAKFIMTPIVLIVSIIGRGQEDITFSFS